MESAEEEQLCRICRTNDPDFTLCRPCKCAGSIGLIHIECLSDWIQSINNQNRNWKVCEICHTEYQLEFRPKKFSQWEKLKLSAGDIATIVISIIGIIFAVIIGGYCMPLFIYDYIADNNVTGVNIWDEIMYICIALFCIALFFNRIVYFVRLFIRWRNQNIALFPKPGVEIIRPPTATIGDPETSLQIDAVHPDGSGQNGEGGADAGTGGGGE